MQKIYFKKMIDLHHQLKELISVAVDESIHYQAENQGIRAIGSIMINGEYKDEQDKHAFTDTINLDILAQFSKIEDKKDYCVKVEDFDYTFVDGNLSLVIQACIYGVKDDEDRVIETGEMLEEDISENIENMLREEDMIIETPIESPTQTSAPINKEEINDDEQDIGTYYLYVVQDGDTYQSIAARYQVDEYQVQSYNHDRPLSRGTIVIIPYFS